MQPSNGKRPVQIIDLSHQDGDEIIAAMLAKKRELKLIEITTPSGDSRIREMLEETELEVVRKDHKPETHWVQFPSDPSACPVFEGDTRVEVINPDE